VIAIDTNVLVRLVANDDPVQSPRAAALLASSDVFVSKTVILETEWVLRHAYELDVATIASVFTRLVGTASISVEDAPGVRRALEWFKAGMDFADALHLASSADQVEHFATFDKKLAARAAKANTGTPVVCCAT
jgi:predicted nucleic-acid-binding protein